MMKKVIIFLIIINFLKASIFSKNKLYLVDINNNPSYSILFNQLKISLKEKFNTKIIRINNNTILSLLEYSDIYSDKRRLIDGLRTDRHFYNKGLYVGFNINILPQKRKIIILSFKYDTNNKYAIALLLEKKYHNQKEIGNLIFNMMKFFIYMDKYNYKPIYRSKASGIVIKKDNKIFARYYKRKKTLLLDKIESDDIDLAKNLGLIKGKINSKVAEEFCNLLGLDIADSVFSNKDMISLEDLYEVVDFKSGIEIRRKVYRNLDKDGFRCIGKRNIVIKDNFDNYLLNTLGVYKIEKNNHSVSLPPHPKVINNKLYFYKDEYAFIDIFNDLYIFSKKIFSNVKGVINNNYKFIFFTKENLYAYTNKVSLIKSFNDALSLLYKVDDSHFILTDKKAQIYLFNSLNFHFIKLPTIGVMFYKFDYDNKYIIAHNIDGNDYYFLYEILKGRIK